MITRFDADQATYLCILSLVKTNGRSG